MNLALSAAGLVAILVAAVHSIQGERLIFGGEAEPLPRFRGIIRATWIPRRCSVSLWQPFC